MVTASLLSTAFVLGAAHALEPGHGKSAMVGALLGSKRPWRDPLAMGFGTAGGHTLGVFLFANLSFFLAHEFLEDELRYFLELGIGSLLFVIGSVWLFKLFRSSRDAHAHSAEDEASCCGCQASKAVAGKHVLPGVGFLIGLIPCPTVVALAVASVSFTEQSQVLFLSAIFGLGVALTLTTVGLVITHFSSQLGKLPIMSSLTNWGQFIGPATFVFVGAGLLLHAVGGHH